MDVFNICRRLLNFGSNTSGIVTLLLLFNDRIILLISSTLASGKSNDFSVVIDLFALNKYTRVRAITYYYLFHI